MLFRNWYRFNLPHTSVSQEVIFSARDTDNCIKTQRQLEYNYLQNIRALNFEIGDDVLVRNYKKSTKYDPFYLSQKFQVADILAKGHILLVRDTNSSVYFKRHPNDLYQRFSKKSIFKSKAFCP